MKNSRRPSRLSITSLDSGDDKLYQEKLMKDQKKVGHGAWRAMGNTFYIQPRRLGMVTRPQLWQLQRTGAVAVGLRDV